MRGLSVGASFPPTLEAASIIDPARPNFNKMASSVTGLGRSGNILPYLLASAVASESFKRGAMTQLWVLMETSWRELITN